MTEKNLEKSILDELIKKAQIRAQKDLQLGYQEHRAKSKEEVYWEVYWDAYDEAKGDKDKRLICPMCGTRSLIPIRTENPGRFLELVPRGTNIINVGLNQKLEL